MLIGKISLLSIHVTFRNKNLMLPIVTYVEMHEMPVEKFLGRERRPRLLLSSGPRLLLVPDRRDTFMERILCR